MEEQAPKQGSNEEIELRKLLAKMKGIIGDREERIQCPGPEL